MSAWFVFTDSSGETSVAQVEDPALIQHGREVLAGTATENFRIGGVVEKAPADFNVGWSFHIDPAQVQFYDASAEAGDLTMRQVEAGLHKVGNTYLPHRIWACWSSEMLFELSPAWGGEADDVITGTTGHDLVMGEAGKDHLRGRGGSDYMNGGVGRDTLEGDAGDDKLSGGVGADVLDGGGGADTLIGASGADTLTGGRDRDVFLFNDGETRAASRDLITDLSAKDTLHLAGIDGDVGKRGDQALVLVEDFSGEAGELIVRYESGRTVFMADLDGDMDADFVLGALGDHTGFANFVL